MVHCRICEISSLVLFWRDRVCRALLVIPEIHRRACQDATRTVHYIHLWSRSLCEPLFDHLNNNGERLPTPVVGTFWIGRINTSQEIYPCATNTIQIWPPGTRNRSFSFLFFFNRRYSVKPWVRVRLIEHWVAAWSQSAVITVVA